MIRLLFVVFLTLTAASPTIFQYQQQLRPIVGGDDTSIEQYPWQISMTNFGSHRCGGSILTTTKIVSAAHCVRGTILQNVGIRAGSSYKTSGGVLIPVRRIIEHESFNVPIYFDNDIALLFLEYHLTFGPGIQPVTLPDQGYIVPDGTYSRVSGWGALYYRGTSPEILQVVTVPIVNNEICKEANLEINPVTDGMICAGYMEEGGRDACSGDSGGPMIIGSVLHGVVSWGNECALPGFPGVYARVAHYRNWIDSWNL